MAYPRLAEAVSIRPEWRGRLWSIFEHAHDYSTARKLKVQRHRRQSPEESLSPREHEVFELLSQGKPNKEIARLLYISEATVKVHVRRILAKLGARTRTEAVVKGALNR
jgi:DNA-binding NarL/FixJ family response regulator